MAAATNSKVYLKTKKQWQLKQQHEEPLPKIIELTPELTKEVSFNDIEDILSISIKKDRAPKLITFCAMLLAQTNKDQLNVGFQAESAAGKSYIPLELASYFPQDEIMKIASASPTSFYHKGVWDNSTKSLIVDLERKIIIFLDMPHFLLLEKLRPLLSHDDKELHYMITDKNKSGAIRTKDILIRGPPLVFFCTAKMDQDDKRKMLVYHPVTGDICQSTISLVNEEGSEKYIPNDTVVLSEKAQHEQARYHPVSRNRSSQENSNQVSAIAIVDDASVINRILTKP